MSQSPLLAWHFLPADRRLRFGDRRLAEPGRTLTVSPPLLLDSRGLHASVRPIDALSYAPGPILCRVALSGEILEDKDKVCAEHRTVLCMADATRALHLFACDEAERALQIAKVDEPRCAAAIKTKRRWLDGEATDEELDAAWAAAWDVDRVIDKGVGWGVGWARAAVRATARAASGSTAWLAAREAARTADLAVGRDEQNERLTAVFLGLQPKEAE